jgi:L-seryl-tRNA(Ser) seleniumtransferase
MNADLSLDDDVARLYADLDARPVINAAGAYTILGGSQLSPGVLQAMADSNRYFADLKGLLLSSGTIIAERLGAEAALVTSGAAAALALASASCMTREHPEMLERLPDSRGIPNQVLTQRLTRQKYDRCIEFSGAHLIEYGGADGTSVEQLTDAIGPETVALHYFVPPDTLPGLLPLETVIEVGHACGLPVIVDAAGHTYPLDEMKRYARAGADLVCYASKYFNGPNSAGVLVGRKDLIDLAMTNSFIGFETSGQLTVGRPMKVDRQEVFAVVVALREWLSMDHEERWLGYAERCDLLLRSLAGSPGVREAYRISEREVPVPVVRDGVRLVLESEAAAQRVFERMRDGEPSIWVKAEDDHVNVSVAFCNDAEFEVVARRLREALEA